MAIGVGDATDKGLGVVVTGPRGAIIQRGVVREVLRCPFLPFFYEIAG
jgi:hypothetical protein